MWYKNTPYVYVSNPIYQPWWDIYQPNNNDNDNNYYINNNINK